MLLLDTHTYLWFISENPLLPQWVSQKIQTDQNVFVSIATFWEIAIKNAKGLLNLPVPVSRMMEDCATLNFTILPINGMHLDKLKVCVGLRIRRFFFAYRKIKKEKGVR